jgi:pimeloyl-ACP methyl ester carboxylesterase
MQIHRVRIEDQGGSLDLNYTDWAGPDAARTVVCVHGLTRNSRDFDRLAEVLSVDARVICPDMVGRGRSDRLADPERYVLPTYVGHMIQLLDRLELDQVDWVGTSMSGLIGMAVAAESDRIRCLVLNDVGPFLPNAVLEGIGQYLGLDLRFADLAALETHLRVIHAGFGPLTDAQWRHLAEHSAVVRDDGTVRLSYDQRLALAFKREPVEDIDLWPVWDRIRCPVLLLRGAESALLAAETAALMARRGPGATIVEIEGTGHAPALMARDQIEIVRNWLGD